MSLYQPVEILSVEHPPTASAHIVELYDDHLVAQLLYDVGDHRAGELLPVYFTPTQIVRNRIVITETDDTDYVVYFTFETSQGTHALLYYHGGGWG